MLLLRWTRALVALSLWLGLGVWLTGCHRSHFGVGSSSEYGYAAHTPDELAKVRARFDKAVALLETSGLRASKADRSEPRTETVLSGNGAEARLTLLLPDTGLASITLAFNCSGSDPQGKAEAESLLARVQKILAPDKPAPATK